MSPPIEVLFQDEDGLPQEESWNVFPSELSLEKGGDPIEPLECRLSIPTEEDMANSSRYHSNGNGDGVVAAPVGYVARAIGFGSSGLFRRRRRLGTDSCSPVILDLLE